MWVGFSVCLLSVIVMIMDNVINYIIYNYKIVSGKKRCSNNGGIADADDDM